MTQKKERNSSKSSSFRNLPYHNFFTGLGSSLLGIAACIALSKTDTVLDEIFKIQETAKDINKAVCELGKSNCQIVTAVDQLKTSNNQIMTAVEKIDDSEKILKDTVQEINILAEKIKKDTSDIKEMHLNELAKNIEQSKDIKKLSKVLNSIPTEDGNLKKGDLYLPTEKVSSLKKELQEKAPKASLEEITDILKENLKIWTK